MRRARAPHRRPIPRAVSYATRCVLSLHFGMRNARTSRRGAKFLALIGGERLLGRRCRSVAREYLRNVRWLARELDLRAIRQIGGLVDDESTVPHSGTNVNHAWMI